MQQRRPGRPAEVCACVCSLNDLDLGLCNSAAWQHKAEPLPAHALCRSQQEMLPALPAALARHNLCVATCLDLQYLAGEAEAGLYDGPRAPVTPHAYGVVHRSR